jgi:hypothetical protein
VTTAVSDLLEHHSDTVWWYAVVDASAASDALANLGDPTLSCVTVGALGLIVSSEQNALTAVRNAPVQLAGVDQELAKAAVHHDEVVSGLAALVPALVPIRFGTLADSEDLSKLSPSTVERCSSLLERVRSRQEWGLRLMASGEGRTPGQDDDAVSGAAYLAAVRDRHRARRETAARREEAVARLQAELGRLSDEVAQLSTRRPGQLASLACLVHRDRTTAFHDTVRAAQADLSGCGVDAVLTGPWAPYSFTGLGASA